MINIFINVRSFKYLLFALSVLIVESKMFCQGYPCAYLQPPWPMRKFMHLSKPSYYQYSSVYKPSYYQYPSVYYYQYSAGHGFQVPTVGSLSNYPFQRPPLPLVIVVTKLPDQSSDSNQQAVQVLTPTSEPLSSSSAAPTTEIKPVDTAPLVPAATTQTSTPQSTTPTSTPPQQATTLSPIASPQSSSPPVNSTLSPTPSIKPSAPTTLPNYKPPDTTTSNNQRSLDSSSWEDKWKQTVYTSTGTKLCQTNDPRGIFTEDANNNCNNACQDAYDKKVESIGLTETGIMFLGGSCHRQVQTKRDFCLCKLQLGRESVQFLLINEK
uniref:Uncharacterized protein n=1 Tax=Cacopsylla melanoneura TaxID=428564 RepID=A0A8D8UWQ4_9HEMI